MKMKSNIILETNICERNNTNVEVDCTHRDGCRRGESGRESLRSVVHADGRENGKW